MVAVPPLGLGGELLVPAIILSLACLVGILHMRRRGRRGQGAVLYAVLAVSVVLAAQSLLSPAGG